MQDRVCMKITLNSISLLHKPLVPATLALSVLIRHLVKSQSFLVLLLLEFKFLGRNGGFGLPMALLALGQPPGQVVRTRVGRAT